MCTFRFDAIGMRWEVDSHEPLGSRLQQCILERIEHFDATYSQFRPDSLVSRMAGAADGGCFNFPDDSMALFDLYDWLHKVTDGAMDPLVGRDLEFLGYDRRYWFIPVPDRVRAEAHARGRATWVVADQAVTADGLATALFFTGAAQLAEVYRFAYVRIFADGRAEISPNFNGELFS